MRKIFLFGLCVLVFAEPNISTDSQDSYKIKREIIEKDGDLTLDDLKALAPNKDSSLNISDENIAETNSLNTQTAENIENSNQEIKNNANLQSIENSTIQVTDNSNSQNTEKSESNWGMIILVFVFIYAFIYTPIKKVFSFFGGGKSQSRKDKATNKSKPVREEILKPTKKQRFIGSATQRGNTVYAYDEDGRSIFNTNGELLGFTSTTVTVLRRSSKNGTSGTAYTFDSNGRLKFNKNWRSK